MIIGAIIIGCFSGFISAFFGIGGSSIDTPLLRTFLDFPPHVALGTPLPLTLLTVFLAFLVYGKKHLINYRVVFFSLIGGLPGTILGAYLSPQFSGTFLMLLTAAVLFLVGVNFILLQASHKKLPDRNKRKPIPAYYIITVATAIGVLSGILANGGGIFFVPVYVMLFHLRMKEAIATSLLTIAFLALPSSLIHYNLGHIDATTTAALALGVVPMAYLGAKLDLQTKSKTVELLFGALLITFSVYFFISQI